MKGETQTCLLLSIQSNTICLRDCVLFIRKMHYTLSWKSKFDKQSRGQHDGFMTGSADTTWELNTEEIMESWKRSQVFFMCWCTIWQRWKRCTKMTSLTSRSLTLPSIRSWIPDKMKNWWNNGHFSPSMHMDWRCSHFLVLEQCSMAFPLPNLVCGKCEGWPSPHSSSCGEPPLDWGNFKQVRGKNVCYEEE